MTTTIEALWLARAELSQIYDWCCDDNAMEINGEDVAKVIATIDAALAENAPGHTDLMVAPETLDAFMEAHPLPEPRKISDPTEALADAMWQLLDDMGPTGQGVCIAAKARARVALEPFLLEDADREGIMPLDEAMRIVKGTQS